MHVVAGAQSQPRPSACLKSLYNSLETVITESCLILLYHVRNLEESCMCTFTESFLNRNAFLQVHRKHNDLLVLMYSTLSYTHRVLY
jgi:hypothetical protein